MIVIEAKNAAGQLSRPESTPFPGSPSPADLLNQGPTVITGTCVEPLGAGFRAALLDMSKNRSRALGVVLLMVPGTRVRDHSSLDLLP